MAAADLCSCSRPFAHALPGVGNPQGSCAKCRREGDGDEQARPPPRLRGASTVRAGRVRVPIAAAAARRADRATDCNMPPFCCSCTRAQASISCATSRRGRPRKKITAELREASEAASSRTAHAEERLADESSRHGRGRLGPCERVGSLIYSWLLWSWLRALIFFSTIVSFRVMKSKYA